MIMIKIPFTYFHYKKFERHRNPSILSTTKYTRQIRYSGEFVSAIHPIVTANSHKSFPFWHDYITWLAFLLAPNHVFQICHNCFTIQWNLSIVDMLYSGHLFRGPMVSAIERFHCSRW